MHKYTEHNNKEHTYPRVAYFCMEYGLHEKLPVYAGGLGVLAGDYLKSARDLNLPVVGIGILWRQDYTEQFIDLEGHPYDVYPTYNYDFLEDTGVTANIRLGDQDIDLKIWHTNRYGNSSLYLLDAGKPGMKHGNITARLYGGGDYERITQEIILGVGGIRALRALGIEVDLYHFNEGHAVLAALELMREKMENNNTSFAEAWEKTRRQVVFTTHTPVEAGNEKHSHHLLFQLGANNGLTYEQMVKLGGDPFNMTVAALRLSSFSNGVSQMHGRTARKMWEQIPGKGSIISITNGVHTPTWQAPEIARAYKEGKGLWEAHMDQKKQLIEFVRAQTGAQLSPDALLVGFARRAAAYKRSDLIFRNTSVIGPVIKNGDLQLIFSGKAHPNDDLGKSIIKDLVKMDRHFKDNVVFLENYNIAIARKIVRGCDVWLNNPCRPLEASGTSGMKAALNGVLNLSVLDGWVGEGMEHRVCGWLLDEHIPEDLKEADEDERDLHALYQVLLHEVIPTFYQDREKWLEMMKASVDMALTKFTSHRMIQEYYEKMYNKALQQQAPAGR